MSGVSRFIEFTGRTVFGGQLSERTKDVMLFIVAPLAVIGLFTQIGWFVVAVMAITLGCFVLDFRQFNREHRDG